MSARASCRIAGVAFLLASAGFVIYGMTLPNNPPDLIIGGVVVMVGMSACFLIGGVLFVGSFLLPEDRDPEG
jgi:hypothetical protein